MYYRTWIDQVVVGEDLDYQNNVYADFACKYNETTGKCDGVGASYFDFHLAIMNLKKIRNLSIIPSRWISTHDLCSFMTRNC